HRASSYSSLLLPHPPTSTLFPYTTLFRSEIPGVSNLYFLRSALNTIRRSRGLEEVDAMDFLAMVRDKIKLLEMDESLMNRPVNRSEEHTSELQSLRHLVCRLLLEKKKLTN